MKQSWETLPKTQFDLYLNKASYLHDKGLCLEYSILDLAKKIYQNENTEDSNAEKTERRW